MCPLARQLLRRHLRRRRIPCPFGVPRRPSLSRKLLLHRLAPPPRPGKARIRRIAPNDGDVPIGVLLRDGDVVLSQQMLRAVPPLLEGGFADIALILPLLQVYRADVLRHVGFLAEGGFAHLADEVALFEMHGCVVLAELRAAGEGGLAAFDVACKRALVLVDGQDVFAKVVPLLEPEAAFFALERADAEVDRLLVATERPALAERAAAHVAGEHRLLDARFGDPRRACGEPARRHARGGCGGGCCSGGRGGLLLLVVVDDRMPEVRVLLARRTGGQGGVRVEGAAAAREREADLRRFGDGEDIRARAGELLRDAGARGRCQRGWEEVGVLRGAGWVNALLLQAGGVEGLRLQVLRVDGLSLQVLGVQVLCLQVLCLHVRLHVRLRKGMSLEALRLERLRFRMHHARLQTLRLQRLCVGMHPPRSRLHAATPRRRRDMRRHTRRHRRIRRRLTCRGRVMRRPRKLLLQLRLPILLLPQPVVRKLLLLREVRLPHALLLLLQELRVGGECLRGVLRAEGGRVRGRGRLRVARVRFGLRAVRGRQRL